MGAGNPKPNMLFWRRVFGTLIDLSIVYCLSLTFQFLIYQFAFIRFDLIFSFTLIAYYLFSYLLVEGQTIANLLEKQFIIMLSQNRHAAKVMKS